MSSPLFGGVAAGKEKAALPRRGAAFWLITFASPSRYVHPHVARYVRALDSDLFIPFSRGETGGCTKKKKNATLSPPRRRAESPRGETLLPRRTEIYSSRTTGGDEETES